MVLFMLMTASSSSSSSQPDPDFEEPTEDVGAEPDLKFQFALFQDDQSDLEFLADNSTFDLLFICTYVQNSAVTKMF